MSCQVPEEPQFTLCCWGVPNVDKPVVSYLSEVLGYLGEWNRNPVSTTGGHVGVSITHPSGDEMFVGLSGDYWMLCRTRIFDRVTYDGQQMLSVGPCSDDSTIAFIWEQWTEMPRRNLISRELAETTLAHWLRTNELLPDVHWKEVLF